MKTYDIFYEYIWLVKTIYRHKKITLEEINDLWREEDASQGEDMARSTFNRHKDEILLTFGIIIECDRKDGYRYYIANREVLEDDSVQNWLVNTFSVNSVISKSQDIQDRIQIESIPDSSYLEVILDAMKKNRRIKITYRRYGDSDAKILSFDPYALKAYDHRWYVLAHFQRPARNGETPMKRKGLPEGYIEYFGTFPFDRIENVEVLKEKFKIAKDFSVKDFFWDCYGIVQGDDTEAERIVIRAYGREAYNMRSVPLHHSQQEINKTQEYSDFELYMRPTLDFAGKLLSRGEWIEVLGPQWFREEQIEMHEKALARY